ncbi:MAG: ABC transporter ATP-binding protein [Lachnospiraceae bacterium]|nr:ABC transporter ATP-binding protein [Candidatus Colinaster equi]
MQNIKTFFRMFGQLNKILTSGQKRQAVVIALLSIISALLETLGVTVILPFILAMLQPQTLMEYEKVAFVLDLLGITDAVGMITFVGISVILIYVFKNVFIMIFNYFKLRFRNNLERDLSIIMLKSYIEKPYTFFLNVNSAEIMRGITGDNAGVATAVDSYCTLLNECMTCLMIGIVLVLINPIMAVTVLGLAGVIALVMVLILRKRVSTCAVKSRDAFALRYRHSYETVNGIKDIDVMRRQNFFLKKFASASSNAAKANTEYLWIAALPSRATEVIFISGLVLLVLAAYNFFNDDMTMLVAQFSALAVASTRLLPSIANISNAMNALIFQRPALENAYNNIVGGGLKDSLSDGDSAVDNGMKAAFEDVIQVNDVVWRYADHLPNVINHLSLDIHRGEAIGLVGESGAGKSTLADILLGLYTPQNGSITVDGKPILDEKTQWHKMVGYVPQTVFLLDDTVRNNILFGIPEEDADEELLARAVDQAQMRGFVEGLEYGMDTVLGERGVKLSGGQRQRIAIARALYYNPDILVLDEATSALDNETESAVIEAINALQGDKTLIIVAHRLTTIANCDRVFEIGGGVAREIDKESIL